MLTATAVLPSDWLTQTVLRLGDAVGWPIVWNSESLTSGCGVLDVVKGVDVIGQILVEPPDDVRLQPAYEAACEVAQVFADVLSRLATAQHQLLSRHRARTAVHQVSDPQRPSDDLRTKLSALLKTAVHATGLWSAAFFLRDANTERLRLRATHNLPARFVPARCAEQQTAWQESRGRASEAVCLPDGFAVGIAAPVFWQSQVIGMLWCFDRRQRAFGDAETHALESVALQIAEMLERSVLMEESRQRRLLKSDLSFASRALPIGQFAPLPSDCRLDVSVRTASVIEVGGDVCDVIPLSQQRVLFAIGDAVGHGVPAAMLAAVTRGALRALIARNAADELTTGSLMAQINCAVQSITRAEHFVTLMLALLDPRSGTLTYSNAGHPPPLLLRDGVWQSLSSHGLFLGVSPDAAYTATELKLQADDVIIGYTDGVTETVNPSKQVFRRQGIRDTIRTAGNATAEVIAESIWQGLHAHDPHRPLRDDRTLLVMKFLGSE